MPYMGQVITTYVSIKDGIVHPYKMDSFIVLAKSAITILQQNVV